MARFIGDVSLECPNQICKLETAAFNASNDPRSTTHFSTWRSGCFWSMPPPNRGLTWAVLHERSTEASFCAGAECVYANILWSGFQLFYGAFSGPRIDLSIISSRLFELSLMHTQRWIPDGDVRCWLRVSSQHELSIPTSFLKWQVHWVVYAVFPLHLCNIYFQRKFDICQ